MSTFDTMAATTEAPPETVSWSYDIAFARNRGLVSAVEQQRLRNSRVAIAGMGGVGGVHLIALARLGVGHFTIADPDCFELVNFNRQFAATTRSVGRPKAEVLAEEIQLINPSAKVQGSCEPVTQQNVAEFLSGADLFLDGIDFFSIDARRLLFQEARRRGIWAVTAGPIGFSTAWLVFSPEGMSFDEYFDVCDSMDRLDQLIAFAVGLTPRATHLGYLDLNEVSLDEETGPSAGLACHLASGVAAAECLKVLLRRGVVRPAPCYFQFDPYRQILRRGRLWRGNRHPLQRLKRWWLKRRVQSQRSEAGSS